VIVKARRVKCDETKPECLRCQKFGRACDGYAEPPPPGQEPSRSRRRVAVVPIKPRSSPGILTGPSISIHRTEEECRYFEVFVEFSARELPGYFPTDFWSRIVSQESHALAPIRYAAIAIGALNRSLEKAPKSQMKVNIIQNIDKKHHEYAVLYFLRAVQSLNQYLSTSRSPQTRVALICCLLFVCFETFQGSFVSTCRQYYGGLSILRSYCARNSLPGPQSQRALPRPSLENAQTQIITDLPIRQRDRNTSQPIDIIMPIENDAEMVDNQSLDWTDVVMAKDKTPLAGEIQPFVWSPYTNKTAMGGTELTKEQQQMRAISIANRVIYPSSTSGGQSLQLISPTLGKPSSISSDSPVSTPLPYATAGSTASPGSSSVSTPPTSTVSRTQSVDSRSPSSPILHHDLNIEESLIQMFTRLDGSGEYFGMPPLIPPMMWDIHKIYHRPIPDEFLDFPSAQRSWDFLMDEALQFYRRTFFNKVFAPANSDPPAKIAKKYAHYIQKLSAFETAFQPILDNAVESDGTISNPAALILTLYQKCTVIILAAVQDPSEMIYDSYLPEFQYVTSTCARLIGSQSGTEMGPHNIRFSFEVGFIPPLHFAVMKCRDPIIRREGINLLLSSRRQEGMWDSILCGRIGAFLVACEEEGLPLPPIDSPQTNLYVSPDESGERELFDHSNLPPAGDRAEPPGGWEDGKMLADVINHIVGDHYIDEAFDEAESATLIQSPDAIEALRKRRPVFLKDWRVPEKNRVQITVLHFHIPERYIKFKCRKALPGADGSREEREIVLTW
jgi:hypothetical protein